MSRPAPKPVDVARLPRRVRMLVERLQAEAAHWKEQALQAAQGPEDAQVVVTYGNRAEYHGLPDWACVRFYVAPHESRRYVEIVLREIEGSAERYVDLNASDTIRLEPRATNALRLYVER